MYSVKEVSEMLEVSRQTVYNYLKECSKELNGHIFKNKGTTYVDDEGLKVIKIKMGLIQVPIIEENDISITDIIKEIQAGLKDDLMEEIKALNIEQQEEYELKLKEMETEYKKEMQELKNQNKKLIESVEKLTENKKSLFDRIFKK